MTKIRYPFSKKMKALFFDLDGTLTQTFYADDNSYLKALSKQVAIDPSYKYWQECKHLTDEFVLNYFFQKFYGRQASNTEKQQMQNDFLQELKVKHASNPNFFLPIPGAVNFINTLMDANCIIGIATGGWNHVAQFKLNIARFPNNITISGSNLHPTKTASLSALHKLVAKQIPLEDCIYFGDSIYDYNSSKTLGMSFVGVDYKQKGIFDELPIDTVINDFKNIEKLTKQFL